MRFEEWAAAASPADEDCSRAAWNAAIDAASGFSPHAAFTDDQIKALQRPEAPDAWKQVVSSVWRIHSQLIKTLKA